MTTRNTRSRVGAGLTALATAAVALLSACGDDATSAPAPSTTADVLQFSPGTADPYVPILPAGTAETLVEDDTTDVTDAAAEDSDGEVMVDVPDGAYDLGYGVYLDGAAGLDAANTDPLELTDPQTEAGVSLQVLNRVQSEDPNVLLQEYIDTFDGDYTSVAYMPSVILEPEDLGLAHIRGASIDYLTYSADGSVLEGSVRVMVRDDGLSLLMDFWAPAGEPWIEFSPAEWESLNTSLAEAPSVGEPGAWADANSTFPVTEHEVVSVDSACNCQVTLLPDYSVTDTADGMVVMEGEGVELSFAHIDAASDLEDAQLKAANLVGALYDLTAMDDFGVLAESNLTTYGGPWAGTYNGTELSGLVWVMYDPSTQVAVVAVAAMWPGYSVDSAVLYTVRSFMWTQPTLY